MNDTSSPLCSACSGGGCGAGHEGARADAAPGVGRTFLIPTMDCSAEEAEIRRALEPVDGIASLGFQLGARRLTIAAPEDALLRALDAIRQAGFTPQPVEVAGVRAQDGHEHDHDRSHSHGLGAGVARLGVALLVALAAEGVELWLPHGGASQALGMVVAVVAIALAGVDTYTKGLAALRRFKLNINALMTVAVTGAFLIGQWPEAAMVMALYAIAELIEARSVDRARNAIQGLMAMAPEAALVQQPGGAWVTVPVAGVAIGSLVRLRPGERVPLDGTVTRGSSAVNQAPVTGESLPVEKTVGDAVFAGTLNETGELEFRVTAAASDTTLARIIRAVEQAQGTRAPTQRLVDRFAAVYTPVVFVLAVAVAVLLPALTGAPWLQGIYKALVLLVIACPCALVIATPVSVVSALAAAARRGILIKGGTYLEDARRLKALALDKTGTLTEGRPRLVEQAVLRGDAAAAQRLAASLAARSDHPVSRAIAQGLGVAPTPVDAFTALAGRGVQGRIGGQAHVLGNHRLIEERGQCSAELEARLQRHEALGRTVTLLADEQGVIALFAVADTLKPTSRAAVAELVALGVTPVLLTGDNDATAQSIAAQVGIREARGNLLPQHKLDAVQALQQRVGLTGMTGDGINDAPALARADIGIAMGAAGTDTAMEAADVVIMNDDLRRIPAVIRLSRHTHAVLWQNIVFALGVKAVFFLLAVFGSATMWMAVFADMGASLLVVANGLRLLKADLDPPR
ncbi:heavy metal translocating P-type ATPase [Roseateles sp. DXS20W]|uniref:P-type Zn(2+) transporter n=1 Tax=Pelomonas lactea TaxID=3299030 RepID=A0ABW7GF72_9BURK